MIQTEVKKLGVDEHAVHVRIPQDEYNRVYSGQLGMLSSSVKLPGFRSGRTPKQVIEQRFTGKLREDTLSELIKQHYAKAIEDSQLSPAIQPTLEVPESQPETGFEFILKVVTWPEIKIENLDKLTVTQTLIDVSDEDVQSVMSQLFKTQVKFVEDEKRKAELGDQLVIDFAGSMDGLPFEGGAGENVRLVLGEEQFIPNLEQGLVGSGAGEDLELPVRFPETYSHSLAGKLASFKVRVKSIATPLKVKNEDELASIMKFDDAGALKADIRKRLEQEAEQAGDGSTRESVFEALMNAYHPRIPEPLIRQDMRESVKRIVKSSRDKGQEPDMAVFEEEAFQSELRGRVEKNLKLSILVNTIQKQAALEITAEDENEELDRYAGEYPSDQQDRFKAWFRREKEQMNILRDRILEKKCISFILGEARVKWMRITFSDWQASQNEPESNDFTGQTSREAA